MKDSDTTGGSATGPQGVGFKGAGLAQPGLGGSGHASAADEEKGPRKARNFLISLQFAVSGVLYAFRTQRNLRTHFGLAALVLLFSLNFQLTRAEMALLVLTIGLVVAAELFNTAVELVVDLITDRYHVLAAHAKNVAAGGVLAAAITAALVGYVLFFDRLSSMHPALLQRAVTIPSFALLLAVVLVIVLVVAMKAAGSHFRLRGGMPSFHTALAGSLATAVFFLASSGAVVVLAFALAALVAQSRVEGGIHSLLEVAAGGLLGVSLTVLVFQLLLG